MGGARRGRRSAVPPALRWKARLAPASPAGRRPATVRLLLRPLPLLILSFSLVGMASSVTGMRRGGVVFAPADAVARALGDIVATGEGSLTWRSRRGTLTVFEGSPDALWQAAGDSAPRSVPLSAPPFQQGGRWWLPLDALDTLGIAVDGNELTLPGGERLTLSLPAAPVSGGGSDSEIDDLGHGVLALRLFSGGGAAAAGAAAGAAADGASTGGAVVGAMVSDLDMLPLVDPAQRQAIDAALQASGPDKPLLVVITALRTATWQPVFRLSQGGRELEFRYPYRMRLVQGTVGTVGPDAPAAVLLLLPPWFNLYRPIDVTWQGVSGRLTFRR